MQVGISTASLFVREKTESALRVLRENNVEVVEVFLESYCEYSKKFGKALKKEQGDIKVHSIHTLTTQFEPQLYSINERAQEDSFKILKGVLQAAKELNASYYTFHGPARLKKTPIKINFERMGEITNRIMNECKKYGVTLTYENVHWSYYNYIGFFNKLREFVNGIKGTLDIKQARQSDIHYKEFIKEMGEDIVTVHLSDIDSNGKMCLPGQGITNFCDLFKRLKDVGFNGACLLEVYQTDYSEMAELFNSLNYIKEIAYKIF